METGPVQTSPCPTCGKVLRCRDIAEFEHFPFCSERCKMVDLGRWLGGHYHISTDETPEHDEQKNT